MRVTLPMDTVKAESVLPEQKPDGSGVGINYADAMLKPVKLTLPDGRKLAFKRRGLKITMSLGDKTGSALLRRIEYGPDVKEMFRQTLRQVGAGLGVEVREEGGEWVLVGE